MAAEASQCLPREIPNPVRFPHSLWARTPEDPRTPGPQDPGLASTCEVKNLRPLFADVDLDISTPKGQVGTALVKDQRLHLPEPEQRSHEGNRN